MMTGARLVQQLTVTVWLQLLLLPQTSRSTQVRVVTRGQGPLLVTVVKVSAALV